MQDLEKSNSIGHFAALALLWFINILIVIFAMPFLIYNKLRGIFVKPSKIAQLSEESAKQSTPYFPCRN